MIRKAVHDDIPRIRAIRANVRENKLSDPSRVTLEDIVWFIDNPGIFVWVEDGTILGFSAADTRNGNIWALFIDEGHQHRGIGRALFERAVAALAEAGYDRIWLTTGHGTRAESFYRRAGGEEAGELDGEIVFTWTIGPAAARDR